MVNWVSVWYNEEKGGSEVAVAVEVRRDTQGHVLWLTDGRTELGVALDFGLRIVHLSVAGMENLLYRQPADCSDGFCTEEGWKLYGGHRLWLAPECKDSYCPDNQPVNWESRPDGVLVVQQPDGWQQTEKSLLLTFQEDGGIRLNHGVRNIGKEPLEAALWSITTFEKGGTAYAPLLPAQMPKSLCRRSMVFWNTTDPGDPRISFAGNRIIGRYMDIPDYFKMGAYIAQGIATFENKGQRFTVHFGAQEGAQYPDKGCNFELYMNRYFTELESLGPVRRLQPGEYVTHEEMWHLEKC